MKIRASKFFFITNIVVLLLMLIGPILALILIEEGQHSFFLFIPIGMLILFFGLNIIFYLLSPFEVNEEGFSKYSFGRKSLNIKKENITKINVSFGDPSSKKHVFMIAIYYYKNDNPDLLLRTEFSGNLFNLSRIYQTLKKYNYPVEE